MPTPNFEDAPDGSSSVNHTGSTFSEEVQCFWEDIDPWAEIPSHPPQLREPGIADFAWSDFSSPGGSPVNPALPPPHPSYADGSAPVVNPLPNLNVAVNPNRRIEARMFSQGECPPPLAPPSLLRRPRSRRVISDPDAAIRKDPNAWSLREAVELCKLLEVVVPEAGFHIALTGGLLYKEGRRKDCDLMFYQIRQMEPNYEILWKYLTVAGVIRSPSYPENGWLVKATYRGKQVDCLFPNAKKAKKIVGEKPSPNQNAYQTSPPTPPTPDMEPIMTVSDVAAFLRREREEERRTGIVDPTSEARARMAAPPTIREGYVINPAWEAGESVLVRHNDGAPIIYRRSPDAPSPYDPAELLATPAPAPVPQYPPVNLENGVTVRYDPATRSFRTERQAEAAIDAAAEAQDDIPF